MLSIISTYRENKKIIKITKKIQQLKLIQNLSIVCFNFTKDQGCRGTDLQREELGAVARQRVEGVAADDQRGQSVTQVLAKLKCRQLVVRHVQICQAAANKNNQKLSKIIKRTLLSHMKKLCCGREARIKPSSFQSLSPTLCPPE
jgi:hypothetical protein